MNPTPSFIRSTTDLLDDYGQPPETKSRASTTHHLPIMGQHVDHKSRHRKEQTEFWQVNHEEGAPS